MSEKINTTDKAKAPLIDAEITHQARGQLIRWREQNPGMTFDEVPIQNFVSWCLANDNLSFKDVSLSRALMRFKTWLLDPSSW